MSTRAEIDALWEPLHAKLTSLYYVEKKIDRETFNKLHSAIWLFHEKDSLTAKILDDYIVDELTGKLRSTEVNESIQKLGSEAELKRLLKSVLG